MLLANGNMMRLPFIAMAVAAVLVTACKNSTIDEKIAALPPMIGAYKVDPYIEVAAELEGLGRELASSALLRAATNNSGPQILGYQVYVLCRMVFTNKPAGQFRRPGIGAATFIGDTSYSDWPLEPIELVDGIPFVVVNRLQLSGQMEPADAYVRYCMSTCTWSSTKSSAKARGQKDAALAKFVASAKWRTPLAKSDRDYLAAQLR
jgi:hypothetical protein